MRCRTTSKMTTGGNGPTWAGVGLGRRFRLGYRVRLDLFASFLFFPESASLVLFLAAFFLGENKKDV
jgi:hypothetical protein